MKGEAVFQCPGEAENSAWASLTEEERRFLKGLEGHYQNAKDALPIVLAQLQGLVDQGNPFINREHHLSLIHDSKHLRLDFVTEVAKYLRGRYNLCLDSHKVESAFPKDSDLTAEEIVREFLHQVGGSEFREAAVAQIKKRLREAVTNGFRLVGAKLILDRFVQVERFWSDPHVTCLSRRQVKSLFDALENFEVGGLEMGEVFKQIQDRVIGIQSCEAFNRFKVEGKKVKAIQFRKNWNVEVTFADPKTAAAFVAEYISAE